MCEKIVNRVPRKQRLLVALAYVAVGVLTTAVLAGTKVLIERSSWGQEGEVSVFGFLQGSLSSVDPENPVVLIDISDVSEDTATLAKTLKGIIVALKDLNKRPVAVGVDVDFSPSGVVSNDVSALFDACLKNDDHDNDDVPIYLAVGDNKSAPPDAWLGLDKYKDLAAAAAINKKDTRWIPIWVQASNQPERLKTINYSLALEYRRRLPGPPSWIGWAVDRSAERGINPRERAEQENHEVTLDYGERLVNYSKLDTIKIAAKKDIDAQSVNNDASSYGGRLVIIGDVTNPKDFFPVPWRQSNEAGSLLLACATYTLIKEPLFELKPGVRLILDLLIAGFIIALVAVIRYRNPNSLFWIGKQAMFIYISVLVVFVGGFLLVRLAGVMWLDFLLVAFALFLHPKLERLIHRILKMMKTVADPRPPNGTGPIAKAAIYLILTTLMMTATARAQQPRELCLQGVAAIAVRLKPERKDKRKNRTCQFRESEKDSWHGLSDADMMKKTFRPGQDLQCANGCTLVIFLCGREQEYPVTKSPPNWDRLTNPYRFPRHALDDSNPETPAKKPRNVSDYRPANPSTDVSKLNIHIDVARAEVYRPSIVSDVVVQRSRSRGKSPEEKKKEFAASLAAGNNLRDSKSFAEAEEAYLQAAKIVPGDPRPSVGLGNVYAAQEEWTKAEEAYHWAILLGTNSPEIYLALAVILIEKPAGVVDRERLSQAESYLWSAAKMQPQNERIFDLLYISIEKRSGNAAELEAADRRILNLNPKSFRANLRLYVRLRISGQMREARKHLDMAAKVASDSQDLTNVAEAFEYEGKYDRAEHFVKRALLLTPEYQRALLILGLVLVDRDHYAEAMEPLQLAVNASPNDFARRHLLGIAQLRAGNLDKAEQSFNEAAGNLPPAAERLLATAYWLEVLGDVHSTGGRIVDAERVYLKALSYDPDDQEIKNKLSAIRSRLKN